MLEKVADLLVFPEELHDPAVKLDVCCTCQSTGGTDKREHQQLYGIKWKVCPKACLE